MALDRQIDFTGGLNTRIPAHKLPENMVQSATNVDFSHGDIRPDIGIGGDGGGSEFYYEKGATWVSNEGIGGTTDYPITVIETGVTPATTGAVVTANTTQLGNPLVIKETGIYQIQNAPFTFTVTSNVITTSAAHGLTDVNPNAVVRFTTTGTLPTGLLVDTDYYVLTTPSTTTFTVALENEGSTATISNSSGSGSGTHSVNAATVVINNTQFNLGSVSSFAEYSDDLYMGRDTFQITATTITSGSKDVTLTLTDATRVILSDNITGAGIAKNSTIDIIAPATGVVTLDKPATASGSAVTVTVNTTPVRLMDGIINKVYPIEIPEPQPLDVSVSQLTDTNVEREAGHSVKWVTTNFPIPLQWGIARFDDASGAEAGISKLTPIADSLANIDPALVNVPAVIKYKIDSFDANSALYGKFALYRVGGTSTVIKKVQDVYLTSQRDGTPCSVDVAQGSTTTHAEVQVAGLPTGAEWKVKWFGYGGAATRRHYHSGAITAIKVTSGGSGYTSAPVVTIPAPGGNGKQATAYAIIVSGVVKNIVVTEKGSGYSGTITVSMTGNAPNITATLETGSYKGETTFFSDISTVHALYGSNAAHSVDLHFIVKFTSDDINSVTGAPYSDDTREYLFASSNLVAGTVLGDNGIGTHDGCGSIIDFTPPRALIEIEPINDPVSIPYNLKYLTEFNNFFMGAVGKKLHISNYAKPNNFAIDGYLDFDAQITGIISRGGEAAVFTELGLFRVYGSAHNEMRKVQVPTVHGVPVGGEKTIAKIKDSIMYVSHAGICYFDGRNVTVLTDKFIQEFTPPSATYSENVAGVFDDTYYLLTSGQNGWKVDMREQPRICKSTDRALNLHYRGVDNKLYSEAGYQGGASVPNKFSFETRDFTGGNITAEKAYYTVYVTGSDFSGTVNIKCDGVLVDTYSYPSAIAEFNRALSISTAKVANRASIEFVNCTGKIASISVKYDNLAEQQKKRFNSVTLTYTGTPTVIVKVDSITKISSVTLTDPGTGNTGTSILYFPAMTEGHLPHITTDETETSRISGTVYDSEVI